MKQQINKGVVKKKFLQVFKKNVNKKTNMSSLRRGKIKYHKDLNIQKCVQVAYATLIKY